MIEYVTVDGENLSGVLYKVYGFVDAKLLRDTLQQNPSLLELPFIYSAGTRILLEESVSRDEGASLERLWA